MTMSHAANEINAMVAEMQLAQLDAGGIETEGAQIIENGEEIDAGDIVNVRSATRLTGSTQKQVWVKIPVKREV